MEIRTSIKFLTFGSTFIEENRCLMELVGHIESRDEAFFAPVYLYLLVGKISLQALSSIKFLCEAQY